MNHLIFRSASASDLAHEQLVDSIREFDLLFPKTTSKHLDCVDKKYCLCGHESSLNSSGGGVLYYSWDKEHAQQQFSEVIGDVRYGNLAIIANDSPEMQQSTAPRTLSTRKAARRQSAKRCLGTSDRMLDMCFRMIECLAKYTKVSGSNVLPIRRLMDPLVRFEECFKTNYKSGDALVEWDKLCIEAGWAVKTEAYNRKQIAMETLLRELALSGELVEADPDSIGRLFYGFTYGVPLARFDPRKNNVIAAYKTVQQVFLNSDEHHPLFVDLITHTCFRSAL